METHSVATVDYVIAIFYVLATAGFGAWFGFVSCVVLVLGSKVLSALLKRPDTYYDN